MPPRGRLCPTSGLCRKQPVLPSPPAQEPVPPTLHDPSLSPSRLSVHDRPASPACLRVPPDRQVVQWGVPLGGQVRLALGTTLVTVGGSGAQGQMEPGRPGRAGLVGAWLQVTYVAAAPAIGHGPLRDRESENWAWLVPMSPFRPWNSGGSEQPNTGGEFRLELSQLPCGVFCANGRRLVNGLCAGGSARPLPSAAVLLLEKAVTLRVGVFDHSCF